MDNNTKLKKYYVVTPPYTTYFGNAATAIDPPEYGCDVVEVEARTKREAKILGVRELRRIHSKWMEDQVSNGANPFTGLKAHDAEDDNDF